MVLLWDNKEQTKEPGFCCLTWAHPSPEMENKNAATVMTPAGRTPHPPDMPHVPDVQGSAPGCAERPGGALSGK